MAIFEKMQTLLQGVNVYMSVHVCVHSSLVSRMARQDSNL